MVPALRGSRAAPGLRACVSPLSFLTPPAPPPPRPRGPPRYGVKQTRGKFGLGAKMALIWSKMSTGLPIEVISVRRGPGLYSYTRPLRLVGRGS